jgi:uncharacterized protein
MDRLFLDANVLFSAAYRRNAGLVSLWKLRNIELCSSRYALEEARINLATETQRLRLMRLSRSLRLFDAAGVEPPPKISLPEKDPPILLAALGAKATHLITGDIRHFGPYFGRSIEGILVLTPSEYLGKSAGRR